MKRSTSTALALAALGLALAAGLAGVACGPRAEAATYEVTYYYLPG